MLDAIVPESNVVTVPHVFEELDTMATVQFRLFWYASVCSYILRPVAEFQTSSEQ